MKSDWPSAGPRFFNFLLMFICLFLRERERETEHEQGKERGRHRIRSRLRSRIRIQAVSPEPHVGLELTNYEITP